MKKGSHRLPFSVTRKWRPLPEGHRIDDHLDRALDPGLTQDKHELGHAFLGQTARVHGLQNVDPVLFQKHDMPVLVNLFGTVERVAWGMDREPSQLREVGETLAFLKQPEPPNGFKDALKMLPLAKTVLSMKPKTVRSAPVEW